MNTTMPHEQDPFMRRLLDMTPDVPPMIPDELVETARSTDCALSMMGFPIVWFGTAADDGATPTLEVNRVLIGLQLALEGEQVRAEDLAVQTRRLSAAYREAVLKQLRGLDIDAVRFREFVPAKASRAEMTRRMEAVERAAKRLGMQPRFLLAKILGRTLH